MMLNADLVLQTITLLFGERAKMISCRGMLYKLYTHEFWQIFWALFLLIAFYDGMDFDWVYLLIYFPWKYTYRGRISVKYFGGVEKSAFRLFCQKNANMFTHGVLILKVLKRLQDSPLISTSQVVSHSNLVTFCM